MKNPFSILTKQRMWIPKTNGDAIRTWFEMRAFIFCELGTRRRQSKLERANLVSNPLLVRALSGRTSLLKTRNQMRRDNECISRRLATAKPRLRFKKMRDRPQLARNNCPMNARRTVNSEPAIERDEMLEQATIRAIACIDVYDNVAHRLQVSSRGLNKQIEDWMPNKDWMPKSRTGCPMRARRVLSRPPHRGLDAQ